MYIISEDVKNSNINDGLVYDIETVPFLENYSEMSEEYMNSWKQICIRKIFNKTKSKDEIIELSKLDSSDSIFENEFHNSAGLYPEFNKIVCITFGKFSNSNKAQLISYTSNKNEDEEDLIRKTSDLMRRNPSDIIVGFNSDAFDNTNLILKMIKYKIEIPHQLKFWTKKIWTLCTFDIMKFWKLDRWGENASLVSIATYLDLDNPKDVLGGDKVASTYYNKNESFDEHKESVELIKNYCEADVKVTMDIWKILKETEAI